MEPIHRFASMPFSRWPKSVTYPIDLGPYGSLSYLQAQTTLLEKDHTPDTWTDHTGSERDMNARLAAARDRAAELARAEDDPRIWVRAAEPRWSNQLRVPRKIFRSQVLRAPLACGGIHRLALDGMAKDFGREIDTADCVVPEHLDRIDRSPRNAPPAEKQ